MSWYSTGKEAEDRFDAEEQRRESEKKLRGDGYLKRWWMDATPSNEDGPKLIFVDDLVHPSGFDTPFTYEEHHLFMNGHWRNWFTCLAGMRDDSGKPIQCPLCLSGDRPSLISVYTAINLQTYTKKDGSVGNPNKDELVLFACKNQVQKILRRASKKRGGLRGWRVEVTRSSEKAPNTGDTFEFESKIELPDSIQPFDYLERLAPKPVEILRKILSGNSQPVEANDSFMRF